MNNGSVPCEVKSLDKSQLLASFIPKFASTYLVDVKLNGESVPNSPFKCEVFPKAEKTVFNIETIENFKVNQTSTFDIQLNEVPFNKDDMSVLITDALGQTISNRLAEESARHYRVYFNVPVVGSYHFKVFLKNSSLIHSFTAKAYDISKILISDIPKRIALGQKCCFQGNHQTMKLNLSMSTEHCLCSGCFECRGGTT